MGTEVSHKFKVGDRLTRECWSTSYEVSKVDDTSVWLRWSGTDVQYNAELMEYAKGYEPKPDATQETDPSVNRPAHYTKYAIEPIEFIMGNDLPFDVGCIVKYVLRWQDKDGVRDLKKARRYIDMMIKRAEGNTEFAK